jgi:hypothetical protein
MVAIAMPNGVRHASYVAKTALITRLLLWSSGLCGLLGLVMCATVPLSVPMRTTDDFVGLAVGLVASIVVFGLPLLLWLRNRGRVVAIADTGIEDDRRGSKRVIPWDQIEEYYYFWVYRPITGTVCGIRLKGKGFETLSVHNQWVANVEDLAQRIESTLSPRILADAKARWARGESIPFGALTVSREGLTLGKKQLAWDQVESMGFGSVTVWVHAKGKAYPWGILNRRFMLPNASVLKAVASQLAGRPVR